MSYITAAWATNYLKARQFERFYNTLGYFKSSSFTTSTHVFLLKVQDMSSKQGISISSCSSKLLSRNLRPSLGSAIHNPYLHNFTKYTNNNIVQTLDNSSLLSASSDIFPNVSLFDDSLYSYTEVEERERLCASLSSMQINSTLTGSIH